MDNNNLKQIKKAYGEKMSYLCRDLFPMLLETDSLFHLLFNSFHPSRSLYDDLLQENKINDFKNYIMSLTSNIKDNKTTTIKTPQELMLKAEYTLYEIKNTEELSNFKQYYTKDELLCTFKDGENGIDRLKNYHVFFAIKITLKTSKEATIHAARMIMA